MKWECVKFSDLYECPSRNGLTRPSRVRGSGYKMINMGELFANDRIHNIHMELVPMNDKERQEFFVADGDLLFARQSLVLEGAGKCSIIMDSNGQTTYESHLIRVRLNKDVAHPLFYYYYFRSSLSKIKSIVQQGVQAGIRASELSELQVHFPPFATQHRIAGILSAYDDLIENNRKQIKLLEEAAQRLYKEWFVDLRFPGWETTPIVDGLPEGWKKEKLVNIVNVQYGFAFNGSMFNSVGNGTPIIRIRNIPDSKTTDFTTEEADEQYLVHNGDIVIGMDGEFHVNSWGGKTAYLVQRVCSLRPKNDAMKGYILQAIYEPIKYFEKTIVGATVSHLGKKHIDTIEVFSSPDELYVPFQLCFSKRQLLINQNATLSESRDRLLSKLMSGKIEV